MNKEKIKKWIISGVTLATLTVGGYKVGQWEEGRGYPIIDTANVKDTVWFDDSTQLEKFARFGGVKFGEGKF